jgi:HTH-type transcriptional regulator/antitoxin HigA
MNSLVDNIDGMALETAWMEFNSLAKLRPIRSEAEYDHTVALMNHVLDIMGENEQHRLAELLELLASMVASYDKEHYAIEEL